MKIALEHLTWFLSPFDSYFELWTSLNGNLNIFVNDEESKQNKALRI